MDIQRETHLPRKSLFLVVACMITITVVVDVSFWVSQPSSSVNDESVIDANKTIPVSEDSVIDTNQTLCVYLKQFRLSKNKKVSYGIWIDVSEWRTLLRTCFM